MFLNHIRPTDPFSLILTNEMRNNDEVPTHDNAWELQLEGGELGGLSLYSTLGLRALSLRITPVFSNPNESKVNIKQFFSDPLITSLYPNYAKLSLEVFENIVTTHEYWIPDASSICGQVTICNNAEVSYSGTLLYMVVLKPFPGGNQFTGFQSDLNYYLSGKTKEIFPTFYLNGASQTGNLGQSSIENAFEIDPKGNRQIQWCLAFDDEQKKSYNRIFQILKLDFDKEVTRIGLYNQRERFLIDSGDKDWDHAFLASQNSASQLLVKSFVNKHKIDAVESRHPEKTIFASDKHQQPISEGISSLQLWYFLQVLPSHTRLVKDLFDRLISFQKEDGFIPNHTNPLNFQTRFHSFPILARIANEILAMDENHHQAESILKSLAAYLKYWFSNSHEMKIPCWENPMQSLYEDLPIHNLVDISGDGIDSKWVQSPFLHGLLLSECEICLRIADVHQYDFPDREWFESQITNLLQVLKDSWKPKQKYFSYNDISTKKSPGKISILKTNGNGMHSIQKSFRTPQRLNIKIISNKDFTRNSIVEIEGRYQTNPVCEVIKPRQFFWSVAGGLATTENVFDQIISIKTIHLPEENICEVSTSNFTKIDLSSLVPLLVQNKKISHDDSMVNLWIKDEFLDEYGLPFVPKKSQMKGSNLQNLVDLPLNSLILEGLIIKHKNDVAKKIFINLMKGLIKNLRNSKKFYKLYDASDGTCRGEYNIINGMIPLKVFFNLIGIQRWTESEIEFLGTSVFTREIKVQYRGIKVVCSPKGHTIFTSGGKVIERKDKNFFKIKIQK